MDIEALSVIGTTFFLILLFMWFGYTLLEEKYYQLSISLVLLLTWTLQEGYGKQTSEPYTVTQEKLLVSASPSHLKSEGDIGGGFLFFSGYFDQKRYYLLREEVSESLYKDFEVSGEVYLRESSDWKEKGLYKVDYTCEDVTSSYTLLWKKIAEQTWQNCDDGVKEIIVPKGSVIKELKV